MRTEYDFIIVGAGSAGAVIANRLTASGKYQVLLIEAGKHDDNFWMKVPLGIVRVLGHGGYAWYDPTLESQSFAGRSIPMIQGKTLGGGSSINGMLYVRGQKQDYDGWRDAGCTGWGWEEVLPYFKKSECLARDGDDAFHGRDGELKLSWMDDLPLSSRQAMAAVQEYGIPFNEDVNSGHQDGVGYLLATIYRGRRQSTARAFLHPVRRQRNNLTILTESHVQRIRFENNRAVAVRASLPEGMRELRATREIIISAGAIGSPHILQHSGIGDAAHLRSIGIEALVDLPQVGKNLQDHLSANLKFAVSRKGYSLNAMLGSLPRMALEMVRWLMTGRGILASGTSHFHAFMASSEGLERPDLQLAMRPYTMGHDNRGRPVPDRFPAITLAALQTRPFSRGNVRIQSNDPTHRARVDMNYFSDPRDIEIMAGGVRQIRQIATMPALREIVTGELAPSLGVTSDADLEAYLRANANTIAHPVGTVRMGSDDAAPLTPRLQVRGVDGLRVADASVMPQITSGNTNAPTIMIGEKAADLIHADAVR